MVKLSTKFESKNILLTIRKQVIGKGNGLGRMFF